MWCRIGFNTNLTKKGILRDSIEKIMNNHSNDIMSRMRQKSRDWWYMQQESHDYTFETVTTWNKLHNKNGWCHECITEWCHECTIIVVLS